jgi:hypothetical protein
MHSTLISIHRNCYFHTYAAWIGLLLAPALCGCARQAGGAAPGTATGVRFTDVTQQAGVRFRHTNGQAGRLYLVETVGSGCVIFDYDGDGRPDLFLVNSSSLPGYRDRGPFYPALYRNLGPGPDGFPHFADVTRQAGLAVESYGMGAAVGDYDNDGHPDLYLTAWGLNRLFHNNGDGTFTDVTGKAGVGNTSWGVSAAWLDYDRDGRLDLLVGNYCHWTPATNRVCPDAQGLKSMCRPALYQGQAPVLYHNRGDGTFSDAATAVGLEADVGKTLGIAVWDEDGDGWPDLYFTNDGERNRFYTNRPGLGHGGRRFEERALETGLAYGITGRPRAGMGVDTADWENRGVEAIAVGNFSHEGTALFEKDAPGHYTDTAAERGLLAPSLPFVTFGVLFCDLDLDGYRDLIATNGHVDPRYKTPGSDAEYAQRMLLFHNEPGDANSAAHRRFREIGTEAGPAFARPLVGRGIAAADLDGDGDPDLLVAANGGPALLLRNELSPRRHWLAITPVGTRSSRDAFGTRIVVTTAGMRQQAWRRGGSSFASQSYGPVLFGLGDHDRVDSVELTWPDGRGQVLRDVKADQTLTVRQQ